MSVNEWQRHLLFHRFEANMGQERAAVMMDLLPPVGWSDIATKDDLRVLGVELRGELAQLRGEMAELRGETAHGFARLQRNIYVSMLASNATVVGLVLGAFQLS